MSDCEVEKMVAAAMAWHRENRHRPRNELELEKAMREMIAAILEAANA
jgi:hypothetical protein